MARGRYYEGLCAFCYKCVEACPNDAIKICEGGSSEILRQKCDNCGECTEVCPQQAKTVFGRYCTVDEALDITKKDGAFYRRSRGGITLGGGEPLAQPVFVKELLKRAKDEYGFHTAIETSGYAKPSIITHVLEHVDFVFCDLKHIDLHRHLELTGVSNELILSNIKLIVDKITGAGKELVIRTLIVPALNDQMDNLLGIASLFKSLGDYAKVELLPYHELGVPKYRALGRKYPLEGMGIKPPSKQYVDRLKEILIRERINVIKT